MASTSQSVDHIVKFYPKRPDDPEVYVTLQDSIVNYLGVLETVREKLEKMDKPIADYKSKTNFGRSVSTFSGVAGTSLTVAGVLLAPVTAGISLGLTIGGVASGCLALASTTGIALGNQSKTQSLTDEVKSYLAELEAPNREMETILSQFQDIVNEMVMLGHTRNDAITKTVIGFVKGFVEVGRVAQSYGSAAMTLINMPVSEGAMSAASNALRSSGLHGGHLLTKATMNSAPVLTHTGAAGLGTATASSAAIASSATFLALSVGFGVAFTVMDIALLINAWHTKHPIAEAIEILIGDIKKEIHKWEKIYQNLQIFLLYDRIQNIAETKDAKLRAYETREEYYFERIDSIEKELNYYKQSNDPAHRDFIEQKDAKLMQYELKEKELTKKIETVQADFDEYKRANEKRLAKLEAMLDNYHK